MRKNRTCMVAILYFGTLPSIALYASFFGKHWTWCRFVDTLHYTMKLIMLCLVLLSFLLAFHLKDCKHTILLFHLLNIQLHLCFVIQRSHLLSPLFFFLPTQVTEAEVKQAKNQVKTQLIRKSLQKLCICRYLFFSWSIKIFLPTWIWKNAGCLF